MGTQKHAGNKFLFLVLILICCLMLNGCATLGGVFMGMSNIFTTLIKIPFKLLDVAVEIFKASPKPPPGVF